MRDNSYIYSWAVFLVWPLLALVSAFANYKSSWAKNILWAFVAFYGFTFAIGAESKGTDILVYINEYQALHSQTMDVASAVEYFVESGEVDVLRTFIAIVLSRFTDNPSILTLVYGIIFGFFFSRNMWYVLENLEGKIKPITILLFICFFLVVPIWSMNGFRFWTATHIFIYGLLPFLFEGKKWGAVACTLSILVHYTFLVPVLVLFGYTLLGNRTLLYFCFFLATFFIAEIQLDAFNTLVENYAPEVVQERSESYRSEAHVESYREGPRRQVNWYVRWYSRALRWSIVGFLIALFWRGRSFFAKNKNWSSLLSFTFLFYGTANLFSSLPSGGRFLFIANLCALALIILYIQNREHEVALKRFIIAATPALLLFVIVSIRMGLISMSATVILGNPVLALFILGEHISLNEVMRMVMRMIQ